MIAFFILCLFSNNFRDIEAALERSLILNGFEKNKNKTIKYDFKREPFHLNLYSEMDIDNDQMLQEIKKRFNERGLL